MDTVNQATVHTKQLDIPHEYIHCALCGQDATNLLFKIRGRQLSGIYINDEFHEIRGEEHIVRCRHCGLVYVNPRVILSSSMAAYTQKQEEAYFAATEADRAAGNTTLLIRLAQLVRGPVQLLDVGFGDGLLLKQVQQYGWNPWGIEVSVNLIDHLTPQINRIQLFHGTLTEARYPADYFDVVTLINVLEHLKNPNQVLAEVVRVTRPGGIVAVHVPNVHSLSARLQGAKWHHYEPLEHFTYFNARTLKRFLEKHNLTVIGTFSLPGISRLKKTLLAITQHLHLHFDNGLGLLARRN